MNQNIDFNSTFILYKYVGNDSTVDENIIGTTKIQNNFWYPLKMVIFPILQYRNLSLLTYVFASFFVFVL